MQYILSIEYMAYWEKWTNILEIYYGRFFLNVGKSSFATERLN